uniref:J domain-containing protein n=1 Tax=Oryza nivara TaxID=4536 RepID=A0A0E0GLR5_ORYNI
MSSVCARPVGVGYLVGGAASSWSQRWGRGVAAPRARVRVSASASTVAPERRAATMYEVLAVEETAGAEEIKAAYRRAARRWHPDACPGGAERFMLAREAYEVLSDPERRRGYDIQLRCCGAGAGAQAARRAGFADWEAQLAGLQWRAASRETWGSRMRHRQPSPS